MFKFYWRETARLSGVPALAPVDPAARVADGLYIGSLNTATNADQLRLANIGCIINLSGVEYTSTTPVFPLLMADAPITMDTVDDYISKFSEGIRVIGAARAAGKNVLVHCAAGVNRSATQLCMYLIECGWTYDDAVRAVCAANDRRGVPCLTNQTFRQLLRTQNSFRRSRLSRQSI